MIKTTQDIYVELSKEINLLQSISKLEMKSSVYQIKTSDLLLANRQGTKERTCDLKEKAHQSDSINFLKSRHKASRNSETPWKGITYEQWVLEEGEESQIKDTGDIFNKIIDEKIPNQKKLVVIKIKNHTGKN